MIGGSTRGTVASFSVCALVGCPCDGGDDDGDVDGAAAVMTTVAESAAVDATGISAWGVAESAFGQFKVGPSDVMMPPWCRSNRTDSNPCGGTGLWEVPRVGIPRGELLLTRRSSDQVNPVGALSHARSVAAGNRQQFIAHGLRGAAGEGLFDSSFTSVSRSPITESVDQLGHVRRLAQ